MQIKARIIFFIVISGLAFSCNNKICPAFQSSFILDDSVRMKHFSYFGEDSLPKMANTFKKKKIGVSQAGIGDLLSYRRRDDKMKTLEMEIVFPAPIEPDSMLLAELDLMADSLSEEEVYRHKMKQFTKPYNVDQFVYMKYFGDQLKKPTLKKQMSLEDELRDELNMDAEQEESLSEEDLEGLSPKERKRKIKELKKQNKKIRKQNKKREKALKKARKKAGGELTEEEEQALLDENDFMAADGEEGQTKQMKQIEKANRKAKKRAKKNGTIVTEEGDGNDDIFEEEEEAYDEDAFWGGEEVTTDKPKKTKKEKKTKTKKPKKEKVKKPKKEKVKKPKKEKKETSI